MAGPGADETGALAESGAQLGRRERKKEATRKAIVDAGFTLFAEKGYAGTTVAEITAAADVSGGTFYFHFRGGKEELLFYPLADRLRMLVERLEHRGENETTLGVLEAHLRQAPDPNYALAAPLAVARRAIHTEVTLTPETERMRELAQRALRDSFAREFSMPPSSFQTRIMATLARAVTRDFGRLMGSADFTPEQTDAYLQQSFAGLRAAQMVLLGPR